MSRFRDSPRDAAVQIDQHVAVRSVNSGKAEEGDTYASACAELPPSTLSRETLQAAGGAGSALAVFVDPSAVVLAVDADGGQVDDRAELRRSRQLVAACHEHRIARGVRRNRDKNRIGFGDALGRVDCGVILSPAW
jgi:hypothetical protein